MKHTLILFAAAVLGALIVLARLAGESPSPGGANLLALDRVNQPGFAIASRATPIDRRIELAPGQAIAPGLPPWTVVLATMPAEAPPPASATPPDVPAAALVPMR